MDTSDLPANQLEAGREFVSKLAQLGMDIPLAMWAYDQNVAEFVLLITTDFFDSKGPLEISKLMFKAYEASLLPREIDPFSVALHSMNHPIAENMRNWGRQKFVRKVDKETGLQDEPHPVEGFTIQGIEYKAGWLLRDVPTRTHKPVEINRRWDRFVRNVTKAAA